MSQCQQKIIDFLEQHKTQVFSVKEIAEYLCMPVFRISVKMKILTKYKEVKAIVVPREVGRKLYGKTYKRKLTLYSSL